MVLPDIPIEYGSDEEIDLSVRINQGLIFERMYADAKAQGFYVDKGGNWEITFNVPLKIKIRSKVKEGK